MKEFAKSLATLLRNQQTNLCPADLVPMVSKIRQRSDRKRNLDMISDQKQLEQV
jgi:hypothetical protein